jgi:hypothetical protein
MPLISSLRSLNFNLSGRRARVALLGGLMVALGGGLRAADAMPAAAPAADAAPVMKGPPLTLPFTEDFESGAINTDIWTPRVAGGGTVTLVQGKGGFGKYVLQAHLPAGAARGYALIGTTRLPETLREHAFGRAYVFITPNGPTRHTVLTYAGTASWPNANFLEVGMYQGTFQLSYQQNLTTTPPRGETVTHGKPLPLGKWFCLEWEVNDSPDTVTVWVDGEPMNSEVFAFKTFGNTNLVKGFADFGFGVRVWGPVPDAYDIYYDSIAFDSKRIGPLPTPPAPMPAMPPAAATAAP